MPSLPARCPRGPTNQHSTSTNSPVLEVVSKWGHPPCGLFCIYPTFSRLVYVASELCSFPTDNVILSTKYIDASKVAWDPANLKGSWVWKPPTGCPHLLSKLPRGCSRPHLFPVYSGPLRFLLGPPHLHMYSRAETIKSHFIGTSSMVQWWNLWAPNRGARVQSLVQEPRSHTLQPKIICLS